VGLVVAQGMSKTGLAARALLERGDGLVSIGTLLLYRNAQGPRADGVLHAETCSAWDRKYLTMTAAEAEVRAGLDQLDAVLSDKRVAHLAQQHGISCTYVEDYETARFTLAAIDRDGAIAWDEFRPRS